MNRRDSDQRQSPISVAKTAKRQIYQAPLGSREASPGRPSVLGRPRSLTRSQIAVAKTRNKSRMTVRQYAAS